MAPSLVILPLDENTRPESLQTLEKGVGSNDLSVWPLMPQPVGGSAECLQVFDLFGSALLPRHDVGDFQKAGPVATRRPAAVLVPVQNLAARARLNGRRVSAALAGDGRIAAKPSGLRRSQFAFSRVGRNRQSAGFRLFMNMDLDRRPAGNVPPGALLVR